MDTDQSQVKLAKINSQSPININKTFSNMNIDGVDWE